MSPKHRSRRNGGRGRISPVGQREWRDLTDHHVPGDTASQSSDHTHHDDPEQVQAFGRSRGGTRGGEHDRSDEIENKQQQRAPVRLVQSLPSPPSPPFIVSKISLHSGHSGNRSGSRVGTQSLPHSARIGIPDTMESMSLSLGT